MAPPKGPFKLVTVNTSTERSRRLIRKAVEALKDRYTILHVANCESESLHTKDYVSVDVPDLSLLAVDVVEPTVQEIQPALLVCWHWDAESSSID
jgi:hypothetical protein